MATRIGCLFTEQRPEQNLRGEEVSMVFNVGISNVFSGISFGMPWMSDLLGGPPPYL